MKGRQQENLLCLLYPQRTKPLLPTAQVYRVRRFFISVQPEGVIGRVSRKQKEMWSW